jgi:signal transduction histidine kinase
LSYFAITISYNNLRNEIQEVSLALARASSEYIELYISHNMDIVLFRATHPDLIKAIEKWDLKAISTHLDRMKREAPEALGFLILDEKGILRNNYPYNPEEIGKNYSHKLFFQDVINKGDFSIDKSYVNEDFNLSILPIAYPVKNSNGTIIAVLVSLININKMIESFEAKDIERQMIVINSLGEIIYHSNFEYIKNRPNFNFTILETVQKALAGREGVEEFYNPIEKNMELTAYTPLKKFGWGVLVAQPVAIAYAPINQLIYNIIITTSIVLVIAIISGYITMNAITKPILEVSQAARQIGKGIYSSVVKIKSKDEIGELARAFNQMAIDLQHKESQLREYAKDLEEKVKLRTKELEARNKEMESFVYMISHDLKSPLVAIQGYANMLLKELGDELNEESKFYLKRIIINTESMQDLISDLLEYSRIGRTIQLYEEINIKELVKEISEEFKRRNEKVKFVIQEALPNIYGEKNRIAQIFSNLIDNAIKYMGDQPQPIIEIGYKDLDDKWEFYVKDNGIGIAEEYHSRLFQLFERIPDERTKNVKGTGIGLAIVKKIVELHNGEVGVESKLGEGSRFYFTIPKKKNEVKMR